MRGIETLVREGREKPAPAKVKIDVSELLDFPKGWTVPEFDCDKPGREFNAGGLYLLVFGNNDPEMHQEGPGWWASIFYGGDVDAVWTKGGFPSAAAARGACVTQGIRMLRECRDALYKADGR